MARKRGKKDRWKAKAKPASLASTTKQLADSLSVHTLHTDIDQVYNLVQMEGCIALPKAARILKMSEDQMEHFGTILQKHGLIRLHYPYIGSAALEKIGAETKSGKIPLHFLVVAILLGIFAALMLYSLLAGAS